MDPYWHEWLNLLIRWIHVITGIAWIGASFYFNWLEGNLERNNPSKGLAGDLWAVHGGGFYHVQKYEVAPAKLPELLHWFKWEAYSTWVSGFALLIIVYYLNPVYLLGSNPAGLSNTAGIALSIGGLIAGWLIYHGLSGTRLVENPIWFTAVFALLAISAAYGYTQVFDGRAAYLQLGAMIGTIMVANVFYVIIPAQKIMVTAMQRGELPDPAPGKNALRRSLHNNYLTLPVLFIMISHHFPSTFGHAYNWAILAALALISAAVRHYFNLKNQGRKIVWILPLALLAIFSLALISKSQPHSAGQTNAPLSGQQQAGNINAPPVVSFDQIRSIIQARCVSCHSATPSDTVFTVAPLGYVLDTDQQIIDTKDKIYLRTIATQTMPLANMTGMTDQERALLGAWIQNSQ